MAYSRVLVCYAFSQIVLFKLVIFQNHKHFMCVLPSSISFSISYLVNLNKISLRGNDTVTATMAIYGFKIMFSIYHEIDYLPGSIIKHLCCIQALGTPQGLAFSMDMALTAVHNSFTSLTHMADCTVHIKQSAICQLHQS